ncbi:response regulator [Croceimicrobium sp.]|uniref:response regulator n=1 Tax=Croceimicrobium sp. TaxID=2828340 RepID=UPI003BA9A65F
MKNLEIIVIDDDFSTVESRIELMRRKGHNVKFFNDENRAEEAIGYIVQNHENVDLVLVDEKMTGGFSGLEFGKTVSKLPGFQSIPLVMLTGLKELQKAIEALTTCGYDYFVWKNDFGQKNFEAVLEKIFDLPSVQTKRELKSVEARLERIAEDFNTSLIQRHLTTETIDEGQLVIKRLLNQNSLISFVLCNSAYVSLISNRDNLTCCMAYLEKDKSFDGTISTELADVLKARVESSGAKYSTNTSYVMFFQDKDKNGIVTNNSLKVRQYILKNPKLLKPTVEHSRKRIKYRNANGVKFPYKENRFRTFIDEIIFDMYLIEMVS